MIIRFKDITGTVNQKPRGGRGENIVYAYEAMKEFGGKIKSFAVVELKPDSKVGYHEHHGEMEGYLILDGTAVANDNGEEVLLESGDLFITRSGEGHSLENKNNESLTFLGFIIEQ